MKLHRLLLPKLYRRLDALKAENTKLKHLLDRVAQLEYAPERTSPLYAGGAPVTLPGDNVMVPYVLEHGRWDAELLEFVAYAHAQRPGTSYHLIDIGANIGLITRQVLAQFPGFVSATCVEPDPGHFVLLQKNNASFPRVRFLNVALSDRDGTATFYRDPHNMGHHSLLSSNSGPGDAAAQITVRLQRITPELLLESVPASTRVFWKSDTEGYDEIIVSALPTAFWDRVDFAAMELMRTEKPPFDLERLKAMIDLFPNKRFDSWSGPAITTGDVMEFLRGHEFAHKNLYLARS